MRKLVLIISLLFAFASTQGQGAMFLRGSQPAPQPGAGILDSYPGAAFAAAPDVLIYSNHSVTDNTVGSQTEGQTGQYTVLVRRDNDDALRSFTYTEVSDGTLTTWVGPANNGFVRILYDQSNSGNHATQTNAANQPKIVDAGSLVVENGKAAMDFDGSNDFFNLSSSLSALATSEMNSFEVVTTQTGNKTVGLGAIIVAPGPYSILGLGSTTYMANRSVTKVIANRFYGQQLFAMDTKNLNGWQNGNTINYTSTLAVNRNTDFTAIGRVGSDHAQMKMQVAIYYTSDQSTNRPGIETAINNEYSIY